MDDEDYLIWYFAQQEENQPVDDESYGIVEDD